MTTKKEVDDFLAERALAVIGVSQSGKGFGNVIRKDLNSKGYRVFPIHPKAETIEGDRCYSSLSTLPETVGGVVIVVPPTETEKVVREVADAGISRVWMQLGAKSDEAVRFCREHGISAVHDHCILMFAEPVGALHRFHRWIWKLLGKLPQ